jgi:putative transposase
VWEQIEPLLPERRPHPLGCHNPRVPDREAMNAILPYDAKHGIEWEWPALDGALGKAPLAGAETGPNPTGRAKKGRNGRSSPRVRASRSASNRPLRTSTTSS